VSRSSFYYTPAVQSEENLLLMRLIDEKYTEMPFYGRRRMTLTLAAIVGFEVNEKRVARLMKEMGIEAIYPKKNLSQANPQHKKYPYLLDEAEITAPNQVWSIDITYVRLEKGFGYLVAMIDWFSRKVVAWRLSNTLATEPCLEVLAEALQNGEPKIVNSDQGCQFTSEKWVSALSSRGISISMDGRGRAYDNIFIERFWRTIKYENIYPMKYQDMKGAREGIKMYIEFYNSKRIHSSLNYSTPNQVHSKNESPKNWCSKHKEKLAA
jgi:putative transposase